MRVYLVAIILVLIVNPVLGQSKTEIDSLLRLAAQKPSADLYFEIAGIYFQKNKLDSVYFYDQKALPLCRGTILEARVRRELSEILLSQGFLVIAQNEAFKALEIAIEKKDSIAISNCYHMLGRIAINVGMLDRADDYYLKSELYDKSNVNLVHSFADALNRRGKYQESISNYVKNAVPLKDSADFEIMYFNIGESYLHLKQYDSAKKYVVRALQIASHLKDSASMMYDASNLGHIYYYLGEYERSKKYFRIAHHLNNKYGDVIQEWNAGAFSEMIIHWSKIYEAEGKKDSLLWVKQLYISNLEAELKQQKRSAAEFSFNSQDQILEIWKENEERNNRALIEYYGITLFIILAVIIYVIFSGRDTNRKYSSFISVVILILSFEFILMVIDPVKTKFTNNEPIYDFTINVALALFLIPRLVYRLSIKRIHPLISGMLMAIEIRLTRSILFRLSIL